MKRILIGEKLIYAKMQLKFIKFRMQIFMNNSANLFFKATKISFCKNPVKFLNIPREEYLRNLRIYAIQRWKFQICI